MGAKVKNTSTANQTAPDRFELILEDIRRIADDKGFVLNHEIEALVVVELVQRLEQIGMAATERERSTRSSASKAAEIVSLPSRRRVSPRRPGEAGGLCPVLPGILRRGSSSSSI